MHQESKICEQTINRGNSSTAIFSAVLIEGNLTLSLLLRYAGAYLGLGNSGDPWIYFSDAKTSFKELLSNE